MRKFQCLLFVLKRSYMCYYIICITVPLLKKIRLILDEKGNSKAKMMQLITKLCHYRINLITGKGYFMFKKYASIII